MRIPSIFVRNAKGVCSMGSFRLLSAACLALVLAASGNAADAASVSRPAQNDARSTARDLFVVAGKSIVVQTPSVIQRVVISDPKIAEALPVTQQELVLHGRAEGETSLILWTAGGGRVLFDLKVQANHNQLDAEVEAMRQNLRQEFPDSDIDLRDHDVLADGQVLDHAARHIADVESHVDARRQRPAAHDAQPSSATSLTPPEEVV